MTFLYNPYHKNLENFPTKYFDQVQQQEQIDQNSIFLKLQKQLSTRPSMYHQHTKQNHRTRCQLTGYFFSLKFHSVSALY